MNDEKYYSVYELADKINVTSTTVYRWIEQGLKFEKQARGRRVRKVTTLQAVNEFLNSNPDLQ